ncbi:hypothetical protein [Loktanella sp. M215]|uniref:hypothetical protein n=1 Tax=Loktanella sp. M215 TaxID=2675431 RepID=UPI001F34745B|nr:hypothetical protein [Loktanella sp. M215]MCF7701391.1 hypothetical protein [Loktanella sp. M215]
MDDNKPLLLIVFSSSSEATLLRFTGCGADRRCHPPRPGSGRGDGKTQGLKPSQTSDLTALIELCQLDNGQVLRAHTLMLLEWGQARISKVSLGYPVQVLNAGVAVSIRSGLLDGSLSGHTVHSVSADIGGPLDFRHAASVHPAVEETLAKRRSMITLSRALSSGANPR